MNLTPMKLEEAIRRIVELEDTDVIFSKKPWGAEAEALIAKLNQNLGVPEELKQRGFDYFLEKPLIDELMLVRQERSLSPEQITDFVIYYATYDAYPQWLNEVPSTLPRSTKA